MPATGLGATSSALIVTLERTVMAARWRSRAVALSERASLEEVDGDATFARELHEAACEYWSAADRLEYGT